MTMHNLRRMAFVLLVLVGLARPALAQNLTTTGSLAAMGDTVTISLVNVPAETIQLTGSWAGVAVVEASVGSGIPPVSVASLTVNGIVALQNVGYVSVTVRAAAWDSGTATVTATRGFSGVGLGVQTPNSPLMTAPPPPALPPALACSPLLKTNCR